MRNDKYFRHDASAANDEKIMMLIDKEGLKGYGAYWIVLEALMKRDNFSLTFDVLGPLGKRSRTTANYLLHIIQDFELFAIEGDVFYSPGMRRRLAMFIRKNAQTNVNGSVNKGAKELNDRKEGGTHARIEENSIEKDKISITDNDKLEGQLEVKEYPGWEKLVDEMAANEEFMDLVGMNSGMGMLYKDNVKRIVEIFKNQVRLQGKQERMVALGEVKAYFSNFVRGAYTGKQIRKMLVKEQRKGDSYLYRFEQKVQGQRMYLGHIIPPDAPPRPDASAVWDDVRHQWGR